MSSLSEPRTYGGWRRSRSVGIGSWDTRQTIIVMSSVVIPLLCGMIAGIAVAVYLTPVTLIVVVVSVGRRGGVVLLDLLRAWAGWRWADWRTHTLYLGQVAAPVSRPWALPGVLAATKLLDVSDPGRGRTGVVWNQRSGQMSVTLLLSPAGALLADTEVVNRQVAAWGALLAGLADDPLIRHAAVTIELVPESGMQLADHVTARLDPTAPAMARDVMTDLVTLAPRAAAQVRARLTITCDPAVGATTPRDVPAAVAEVLRALNGLSVSAAGAEVIKRASATDLIRIVRTAYDPDAESATQGWDDLRWQDASPIRARDYYDHYRHEGAYSMSWALLEAPRQRVAHDVLLHLLSPGRYRRRVTLMYRTLPRDVASKVLESEVNAAATREEVRRRTRRDPNARERADADRAARAAMEEAYGAGLVQWSLYVTTTVPDRDQLAEARREVEQAAGHARLKLRLSYGGQATGFTVGLCCGVYPGDA